MTPKAGSYWKHVKRDSFYKIIGPAKMQISQETLTALEPHDGAATDAEEFESLPLVVYQSLKDDTLLVRPESEFTDGRFVEVG